MPAPLVSVVIPVYNELRTLPELLRRVVEVDFRKELVVVDDGSTDGSRQFLEELSSKGLPHLGGTPRGENGVQVHLQPKNRGKGAALRAGFERARGDILIAQDADLEYDPRDIPRVIQPIVDGLADAVFGSRFTGDTRRVLYYWHAVVNHALTTLSNMSTGLNLTDMETCYKAFRKELLARFTLEEERFGVEPELTAKLARAQARVYEVPVRYFGRTYDEGKKIGWRDGVRALYVIAKYTVRR